MPPGTWLTHAGTPAPPELKLEPEHRAHYAVWKKNPTPGTTGALLRAVTPILNEGVRAYGGQGGPITQGYARRIALQAFDSYDPTKATLRTHLMGHLQGLQRLTAQHAPGISVPERVAIDRQRLSAAENELSDRLGRLPSSQELSDHTRLSMKRIAHIRKYRPPLTEGQVAQGLLSEDDEEGGHEPAVVQKDPVIAKLEFLYHDLDPVDQAIVEHSFGLHGRQVMRPGRIAVALNMSPAAISRRSARIASMLDELTDSEMF